MLKKPSVKQIIKWCIILITLSLMWSCSFFGDRKKGQYIPIEFDLQQEVGPFNGLGANVPLSFYSRRMKVLQTFNELGIKYIRVKREGENWDDILALRASTSRLGIKWIYSLDEIPLEFQDEYGKLGDVKGFAGWWAEEVDELLYQDVPADYIELVDKPDIIRGDSSALTSDLFNALVHETRTELDLRDFQDVSIIGPALSSPTLEGDNETWYMDLDQTGFEMLAFWSVHVWDHQHRSGDLSVTMDRFLNYLDRIESRKPVLVNAFATSATNFNGTQYPDPAEYDVLGNLNTFETYYYSASFTLPYALSVYSNTLDLLKYRDVIPFLYQLYDAPADVKYKKRSWGLLDLNGVEKPVFTLLSNLMKEVPKRATIIAPLDELNGGLNTLAFKNQDEVLVTILNEELESKAIQVSLQGGGKKMEAISTLLYYTTELALPEQGKKDRIETEALELKLRSDNANDSYVFTITLEPQTVFVGEFHYK